MTAVYMTGVTWDYDGDGCLSHRSSFVLLASVTTVMVLTINTVVITVVAMITCSHLCPFLIASREVGVSV